MVPIFLRTCSHTKVLYVAYGIGRWASGKKSIKQSISDPGLNFFGPGYPG